MGFLLGASAHVLPGSVPGEWLLGCTLPIQPVGLCEAEKPGATPEVGWGFPAPARGSCSGCKGDVAATAERSWHRLVLPKAGCAVAHFIRGRLQHLFLRPEAGPQPSQGCCDWESYMFILLSPGDASHWPCPTSGGQIGSSWWGPPCSDKHTDSEANFCFRPS